MPCDHGVGVLTITSLVGKVWKVYRVLDVRAGCGWSSSLDMQPYTARLISKLVILNTFKACPASQPYHYWAKVLYC